jgi:hypothetical protein
VQHGTYIQLAHFFFNDAITSYSHRTAETWTVTIALIAATSASRYEKITTTLMCFVVRQYSKL